MSDVSSIICEAGFSYQEVTSNYLSWKAKCMSVVDQSDSLGTVSERKHCAVSFFDSLKDVFFCDLICCSKSGCEWKCVEFACVQCFVCWLVLLLF